ncbi:phage tail assembly chaperone GT [Salinicoccus sesuvii]|uniref:Phage tail assembly chaperone GT n=1 Tax=Salinicoccus sesuvii TaxID=868281 RepID=A0ABV7N3F8_9STAP
MKEGKDINEMLKMPMNFMLSILDEKNKAMAPEDEERALDRFLDSI